MWKILVLKSVMFAFFVPFTSVIPNDPDNRTADQRSNDAVIRGVDEVFDVEEEDL